MTELATGTHRLLAGELQIAENSCGSIASTEAHDGQCFQSEPTWEDEFMRNVAFSIVLFALAAVQIAVVRSELPKSHVKAVAVQKAEPGTRTVFASNDVANKTSAF